MSSQNKLDSENIYNNGLDHFKHNDFKQGIDCFIAAAKQNYDPAIKELGICFLHGISVEQNLKKAILYFKKSKRHPESQFELAKLFYFGHGVKKDTEMARKLLILSVKQSHPPAIILMATCYVIAGDTNNYSSLFNLALLNNNVFAKHLFAEKLIIQQSKLDKSISFIKDFNWPSFTQVLNRTVINEAPDVFQVKNLLSDIECEYIKYIASPLMRPSMTVDPITGKHVKDELRTSHSAAIDWLTEDPAINLIMKKCSLNFEVHNEQSEVLHVLHYTVGEEYKPHYDFFGGVANQDNFNQDQQRIKTICLYLNNVEDGGETAFPRLAQSVKPEKGNVVFFENFNLKDNKPYLDSLHAGKPIIKGEKWLATMWIRENNSGRGPNYESI